ncbi:MAG TPA: hypothetical protein VGM37_10845 [Armatimonadota bacterium]|jgi:hypothetical protein
MRLTVAVAVVLAGGAAFAQTAPAPDANKVTVAVGKSIEQAVADMAKAAGTIAVVDPAVSGKVSAQTAALSLEPGLTAIAAANHATWRKAWIKDTEIPRTPDGKLDAIRLRTIVEAASAVPAVTVGVLDPNAGQIAMTTRRPTADPATDKWLADKKTVYVLYRPSGLVPGQSASDPVSDYLATQKGSMDSFRNMTPDQRSEALRQGIEMMVNMDPGIMQQMARESMQAMQNLSPEAKQKLFDMSMKMMGGGANPPTTPPQ